MSEIPSQLTGLTCSLEDPICGLLNTATVLCTWYILPGEIRPVFFTVHLPNGTEDVIPGTETSYSFVHSYAERGPENVTFTSNCNNDGGVFYDLQTLFGNNMLLHTLTLYKKCTSIICGSNNHECRYVCTCMYIIILLYMLVLEVFKLALV